MRTVLRPGDLGYLTYLHGVLYSREYGWDSTFEAYVAAALAEFVLDHEPARERIWFAELGEEIVGSIAIVRARGLDEAGATGDGDGWGDLVAQLRWFLVHPAARGRGLGRRLLVAALDFCREAGYRRVMLWTERGLTTATRLYRSAGFELTEAVTNERWGRVVTEERYDLVLDADRR